MDTDRTALDDYLARDRASGARRARMTLQMNALRAQFGEIPEVRAMAAVVDTLPTALSR